MPSACPCGPPWSVDRRQSNQRRLQANKHRGAIIYQWRLQPSPPPRSLFEPSQPLFGNTAQFATENWVTTLLGKLTSKGLDLLNRLLDGELSRASKVISTNQGFRFLSAKSSVENAKCQLTQLIPNQSAEVFDHRLRRFPAIDGPLSILNSLSMVTVEGSRRRLQYFLYNVPDGVRHRFLESQIHGPVHSSRRNFGRTCRSAT